MEFIIRIYHFQIAQYFNTKNQKSPFLIISKLNLEDATIMHVFV